MVNVKLNSVSCQYEQQQHFPALSHYQIQQHHHHPIPQQEHDDYRHHQQSLSQTFATTQTEFDLEKFNQQAKKLQAQINFFNQQQNNHIQHQINSVHHDGSQPHFDFAVNGNYTDLEKASEQFVNLGNMVGKQNIPPKVIKITKTVAVKQPVPVPYPVPVVKVVKEQNSFDYSNHGLRHHPSQHHFVSSAPKPSNNVKDSPYYDFPRSNPSQAPASSDNYHHHQVAPQTAEYDTEPFYVTTAQKETIKIVPVPYYVDEHGNKHEIATSHASLSASSHDSGTESFYHKQTAPPPTPSSINSGKFSSFTFSYHPPTFSTPSPTFNNNNQSPPTYQTSHPHQYTQAHDLPEAKYFYNHDSDNSASSLSASQSSSEQHQQPQQHDDDGHYQYKYVTYEE